jgi:hypothetical protein
VTEVDLALARIPTTMPSCRALGVLRSADPRPKNPRFVGRVSQRQRQLRIRRIWIGSVTRRRHGRLRPYAFADALNEASAPRPLSVPERPIWERQGALSGRGRQPLAAGRERES